MKVLVTCEFSGVVRDAFIDRGHDAFSCDLLPSMGRYRDKHTRGDVEELLSEEWDLVIAHPPCTYLCNSSVGRLYSKSKGVNKDRWFKMVQAVMFFRKCLNSNATKICVENPIPHKYAAKLIGETYTCIIQPWQFGHRISKSTCLWLKNLPNLIPTRVVDPPKGQRILGQNIDKKYRASSRSITFQGIANAMAEQWGSLDG